MLIEHRRGRARVGSLFAAGALVVTVAACGGGDDGGEAGETAASAPNSQATMSTSAASAPASTAAGSEASTAPKDAATTDSASGESCSSVTPAVTVGRVAPPTGMDPTKGLGALVAGSEMAAMYDTLMTYDTESGEYVPNVAESLELGDDGETWTLVLRPDVAFTNGDPLTADVVRQNLERTQASTASHATQLKFVDAIEVVDEQTLTLHSTKANVVPPLLANDSGMMINPAFFADPEALNAAPPAGSTLGPFTFVEWLEGEQVTLQRNPDYWGGEVCIEQLTFNYIASPDALVDAYELGEVDVAWFRNAPQAITEVKELGAEGYSLTPGGTRAIVLNARAGKATSDPRLRQAMAMAIDYPSIIERVNGGVGEASGTIYPESSSLYPGPGVEYDVEGARAIVEELRTEGADLSIDFVVSDAAPWAELGITVQAMLQNIGLEVTIINEPAASITQRLYETQDFEMISWAITAREDLPGVYVGNAMRNAGIEDPAVLAAIDEVFTLQTTEELQEGVAGLQELWNEQLPEILLTHDETFIAVNDELTGVVFSSDAKVLFADASRG